jgi:hypothetical protein
VQFRQGLDGGWHDLLGCYRDHRLSPQAWPLDLQTVLYKWTQGYETP